MPIARAYGQFVEVYSTADSSIQFITLVFYGSTPAPPPLAGQTLISSDGKTEQTFTFANNVTHYGTDYGFDTGSCAGEDGCWWSVLVATQGFADLNLVKPDFVVPNGFLYLPGGTVRLGAIERRYEALPADGENALWGEVGFAMLGAVAFNNVGDSYVFMPAGINGVVEYYNPGLDDYFLTAYSSEFGALDAHPGWQRTGFTLAAWTSPFSVGAAPPRNLVPVCRLWLLDSHFYSISKTECADVLAQYRAQHSESWFVHESDAAFFATLPEAETGACPADQVPAYRLWSPRGSDHRYTTETVVRDEMLTRGWIVEGYGPDGIAMCVGGNR